MGYFNENYMQSRRQQWLRTIHAVEAQVGSEWHRGEINQKSIEGENLVLTVTFPALDSKTCTITASRIIDTRGEVAAYQQRAVKKASGQGTMIKITIPIREIA